MLRMPATWLEEVDIREGQRRPGVADAGVPFSLERVGLEAFEYANDIKQFGL